MYCKNCGNELKENEVFCGICGNRVIVDNTPNTLQSSNLNIGLQNTNQQNYNCPQQGFNNNQNFNKNDNNLKNTISLIIGIISLVLVFIFQIFTMPLSTAGLIIGISALRENKKYKIGLILNTISLVLAIPIFIFFLYIYKLSPSNPVIGTWDCKGFSGLGLGDDYIVTMQLNNDNEFIWNKYNDAENNHVIGTYEFEDLHKIDYANNTNYYQITLNGEEFVNNGKLQSEVYKSKYEMGISKNTDEAVIINVNTNNMYYCYRSNRKDPEIKR